MNAARANAKPHERRDNFMLKTFFRRDAFEQFFIGSPAHRPTAAAEISSVVFNAAITIGAVGKQRAAVAFERRRNRFGGGFVLSRNVEGKQKE